MLSTEGNTSDYDDDSFGHNTTIHQSKIFAIEMYDNNRACFEEDEEIQLEVRDESGMIIVSQTGSDVFLKETSIIGRGQSWDICLEDPYVSIIHCKLDWTHWFRKRRLWTRQYALLLKVSNLPMSLWRHIFEFIKEPRHIKMIDKDSQNGTMVALKPMEPFMLEEKQKFRFGEGLVMNVSKIHETIHQEENETRVNLEAKLKEKASNSHIASDYLKAEEGDSRDFNMMSFKVSLFGRKNTNSLFSVVTNKKEARFLVGSSAESNIIIKHGKIDDFQCEIVFKEGKWSIVEWDHENPKKRTYFKISQGESGYKITENADFWIGKAYLSISFPNKSSTKKERTVKSKNFNFGEADFQQKEISYVNL